MLENESSEVDSGELSDERMDELIHASENKAPAPERAMSKQPEAQAPAERDAWEFQDAKGNKFKATKDEILRWREQVSGLPQRAAKWNQEKQQWEQQKQQWEQQWGSYRKVDEWASKNPDQWKSIEQAWREKSSGLNAGAIPQEIAPVINQFNQKLSQYEQSLQSLLQDKEQQKIREEDEKLGHEIKSIQDKYPDLDLTALDDSGLTLEKRILKHADENGIKNFGTAFRDYCHDMLIARTEAQAKQSVAKGIQTKTKLGILGESNRPMTKSNVSAVKDIRNKNYEDIMDEIRGELRSGSYN